MDVLHTMTPEGLADAIERGMMRHPEWMQTTGRMFEGPFGVARKLGDPDVVGACALGFAVAGGYPDYGSAFGITIWNDSYGWTLRQIVLHLRGEF